jgi:hypothetical protein
MVDGFGSFELVRLHNLILAEGFLRDLTENIQVNNIFYQISDSFKNKKMKWNLLFCLQLLSLILFQSIIYVEKINAVSTYMIGE